MMMLRPPKIFVLDDDFRVREALADLCASENMDCTVFRSAAEYIRADTPEMPNCLILDLLLPDINGLELQNRIAATGPPVVFITGQGDIPSSVRAMKAGAVDFLMKPFKNEDLLAAIAIALERDAKQRWQRIEGAKLEERYKTLTPREREVLPLVVRGLLNKQAAGELGISAVTLQIHRGRLMRKMKADSVADLVRMASMLDLSSF